MLQVLLVEPLWDLNLEQTSYLYWVPPSPLAGLFAGSGVAGSHHHRHDSVPLNHQHETGQQLLHQMVALGGCRRLSRASASAGVLPVMHLKALDAF